MLEEIREVVMEQLGTTKEETKDDVSFFDLGADSLDNIELLMALEAEFGKEISNDDAKELKTINDVLKLFKES